MIQIEGIEVVLERPEGRRLQTTERSLFVRTDNTTMVGYVQDIRDQNVDVCIEVFAEMVQIKYVFSYNTADETLLWLQDRQTIAIRYPKFAKLAIFSFTSGLQMSITCISREPQYQGV